LPPPPATVFTSDPQRLMGYNCSEPLETVSIFDTSPGAPAMVPGVMNQPKPSGLFDAWPRQLCPTDDDADGLRFLYPECDELLTCETVGGGELLRPELNQSWGPGCHRYVPTHTGYNIVDYYVPRPGNNWSNLTWSSLPFGRALPSIDCVVQFRTSWGKLGVWRLLLIFYRAVFPPIFFLCILKAICLLLLRAPFMRETRLRNEKLQRTALKRKAEVRRMSEGGQEYAVKRAAKETGQMGASKEVMQQIQQSTTHNAVKAKRIDVADRLKSQIQVKKTSIHRSDEERRQSISEGSHPSAGAPVAGMADGAAGVGGSRVSGRVAPAPAEPAALGGGGSAMASELRALTAKTQSDAAEEEG